MARRAKRTPSRTAGERPANAATEFIKCSADAAYFTHNYGMIDDAQGHGDGSGVMPFHLWPAQTLVIWQMMVERLIIILKARQLGISWLCCSYALWLCLFQPGRVVLLFSKRQDDANELKRRIEALYQRLPDWMREAGPELIENNTSVMGWSNGSRVESHPATPNAGRSLTASLVILDEAAFLQWAEQLYTALKPTIDGGGQLIILSTANGLGGLFHRLWTMAAAKANKFKPIFLPWWSRPGRSAAWYADQLAEATDEQQVKQEYPATALEAFITSGRARFKAAWLEAQSPNIRAGLTSILLDALIDVQQAIPSLALPEPQIDAIRALEHIPGLEIYDLPKPGRRYVIGADVAEGLEHGDYSAATLIDAETWQELASIRGHYEPDTYADYLQELAEAYGQAEIAPERNNHGHAVLATLKRNGYTRVADGTDGDPGWLSNIKTKPESIDKLAEALRDKLITVRNVAALNELQIYITLPNGKTSAPEGYHDDLVMAWAIALMVASQPPKTATGTQIDHLWKKRPTKRGAKKSLFRR